VKLEPSASEKPLDPQSPFGQHGEIIVEQREIIDVSQVWCLQHLSHEMIETIEIKVCKKLAGQIPDWQSAATPKRLKEVVSIKIEVDRFLRIRSVND
jgi:hypothetical protein